MKHSNFSNIRFDAARLNVHLDANETMLVTRELEAVESQVYRKVYPDLLSDQLIPVMGGVHPGAKTTSFDMVDRTGKAKLVASYADDAPVVEVTKTRTAQNIFGMQLGWVWSIQDVRAAAMAGVPLETEGAFAVRDGIERAIDQICAIGDTESGLQGLLNHSAAPAALANPGGVWTTSSTVAQLLTDLNYLVNDIVNDTKNVDRLAPDTLILPIDQFTTLNSVTNANTDKTAARIFLETNPYIKTIVPWYFAADPAGTGPRACAYRRDPMVVSKVLPQPFEFMPPQQTGMVFKQLGHARTAGVKMRYPVAVRYMDGI